MDNMTLETKNYKEDGMDEMDISIQSFTLKAVSWKLFALKCILMIEVSGRTSYRCKNNFGKRLFHIKYGELDDRKWDLENVESIVWNFDSWTLCSLLLGGKEF